MSNSSYKRKICKIAKTMEGRNPIFGGELHGWEIRYDRPEEFDL